MTDKSKSLSEITDDIINRLSFGRPWILKIVAIFIGVGTLLAAWDQIFSFTSSIFLAVWSYMGGLGYWVFSPILVLSAFSIIALIFLRKIYIRVIFSLVALVGLVSFPALVVVTGGSVMGPLCGGCQNIVVLFGRNQGFLTANRLEGDLRSRVGVNAEVEVHDLSSLLDDGLASLLKEASAGCGIIALPLGYSAYRNIAKDSQLNKSTTLFDVRNPGQNIPSASSNLFSVDTDLALQLRLARTAASSAGYSRLVYLGQSLEPSRLEQASHAGPSPVALSSRHSGIESWYLDTFVEGRWEDTAVFVDLEHEEDIRRVYRALNSTTAASGNAVFLSKAATAASGGSTPVGGDLEIYALRLSHLDDALLGAPMTVAEVAYENMLFEVATAAAICDAARSNQGRIEPGKIRTILHEPDVFISPRGQSMLQFLGWPYRNGYIPVYPAYARSARDGGAFNDGG